MISFNDPGGLTYLEEHEPVAVVEILDLAAQLVSDEFDRIAPTTPPRPPWPRWWPT